MYENEDYFIPIIWEGDGSHPSPNYAVRYGDYNVMALPSSALNGDTFDLGGGAGVLGRYQTIYNNLINVSSPMELDVLMSVTGGQIEITADALMTETIAADDYRIIFLLTYFYSDSYNSTVVEYYEEDFTLATSGSSEQFVHSFDVNPDLDLANTRAVVLVQHVNTTGVFTVAGYPQYPFNMYPILQAGMANYPLSVGEPIEDQIIVFNETIEFDVTNYFQYNGTPVDIDLTVESSDPLVATAVIEDDVLTVTGQQTVGEALITISGEYEGFIASDIFEVSVISPNTIPVIFHLYDSYGDGWNYLGNENFIQLYEYYITLESGSEGEVIVFLEPGIHDYTYTATDNYGSENSWTINLEDGTELGSGQGAANGTYDFSFTLEGPPTGTLSGIASLDGAGDVTEVAIAVGGLIIYPDAQGNYTIDLPVGVYTLTATLEGYDDYQTDVAITEDETTTLDFEMAETVGSQGIIVTATALNGNYPNPFNPVTNIAYSVKESGNVTLEVYNIKGQLVKTLVNDVKETGEFTATWTGTDNSNKSVSSGVYFYKMKSGNYAATKKMILMK